jgi:hypothetical protein
VRRLRSSGPASSTDQNGAAGAPSRARRAGQTGAGIFMPNAWPRIFRARQRPVFRPGLAARVAKLDPAGLHFGLDPREARHAVTGGTVYWPPAAVGAALDDWQPEPARRTLMATRARAWRSRT